MVPLFYYDASFMQKYRDMQSASFTKQAQVKGNDVLNPLLICCFLFFKTIRKNIIKTIFFLSLSAGKLPAALN